MYSTEFLRLIAKNDCRIVLEPAFPVGKLKRDFVSIKSRDGRPLSLSNPQGYKVCPVELPRETLDDFIRASFVEQEGPADDAGSVVYRLSDDGRERGLS